MTDGKQINDAISILNHIAVSLRELCGEQNGQTGNVSLAGIHVESCCEKIADAIKQLAASVDSLASAVESVGNEIGFKE